MGSDMRGSGGRAFQAGEAANTKAPRWEWAAYVWETEKAGGGEV